MTRYVISLNTSQAHWIQGEVDVGTWTLRLFDSLGAQSKRMTTLVEVRLRNSPLPVSRRLTKTDAYTIHRWTVNLSQLLSRPNPHSRSGLAK